MPVSGKSTSVPVPRMAETQLLKILCTQTLCNYRMHTVTISRIFQPTEFHQSAKRLSQSFVFLQKSLEKHHSKIPVNFLIRQKREHPRQLASGFSNISQFVQPTVHINESGLFCNIIPVILQLFFQIIPITK